MPVEIQKMETVTHRFLFRNYQITFNFLDSDETHTFDLSYDAFYGFNSDVGIAEVKAGRLGWPWIKKIVPLTRENESLLNDTDEHGRTQTDTDEVDRMDGVDEMDDESVEG
jgi:hypothetical protein